MVRAGAAVRSRLGRPALEVVALAAIAYVPFLLSSPGRVAVDSKQYLYLDPSRFLAKVAYLWDHTVAAGTVTHQHIGFLWPMGPWFWAAEQLGLPDWVAQRLWMGTLTFLAALGARWLLRHLGVGPAGALVGALLYALSPYQLAYVARFSDLLLPWAGLPWMVELTRRAVGRGGWRHPALLALVVASVSGVNASSVLLVAPGPLLVLAVHAAGGWARAREAVAAALRIGVLVLLTSAWWMAGLRLQAAYALPVLQITEKLETVAIWSTPDDVLRGLGNWILFGIDRLGYSVDQAEAYIEDRPLVVVGFAVPVVAILAGLAVRWRHRPLAVGLSLVGLVVAVGAWPYDGPSLYGRLFRAFAEETTTGLAFRNSPRAVPLMLLGFAMLVGAALTAVRRATLRRGLAVGVVLLVLGALGPVWTTGWLSDGLERPEELPDHWVAAIDHVDAGDHATRVLEVPGVNFSAYRWGNTVEPITPGLTDRPYIAREVLPYGSVASATFLDAIDRRIQQGTFEPESLAPMARLLGVGDVVVRADMQWERFGLRGADELWVALDGAPGLSAPVVFGGADPVPDVAVLGVDDARPIVRVAPNDQPVVVAGDADGLVDLAAAGLIDGNALVLLSGAMDDAQLDAALDAGADLVLTDTNRRRIQTWFYTLRDTRGPTEQEGETLDEPSGYDARLDPLAAGGDDARSVVRQLGGTATATTSGGAERSAARAAAAIDGDVRTAWQAITGQPEGARWSVELDDAVSVDRIALVQPQVDDPERRLTAVRVHLDDDTSIDVALDESSWTPDGQEVAFPRRRVERVEVEIVALSGEIPPPGEIHPVGLAEVRVGDAQVVETVRLPVDLLDRAGTDSDALGLDVVLTRLRSAPGDRDRPDPEVALDRTFELPSARAFGLSGTARPAPTDAERPTGSDGDAADGACRDDLLRLDGRPVAVRVADGDDGRVAMEGCEPIQLAAGEHRLVAVPGHATGIDLDRLVLSSAPGGAAGDLGVRGAPAGSAGAEVTAVDQGRVDVRATVETDGEPFWMVLGQSANAGWEVDVEGGSSGPRRLVDGYANGWLVDPDGAGVVEVTMTWTPQRLVWAGLAVSIAGVALCIGLVVATAPAVVSDERRDRLRDRPELRRPFGSSVDPRAGAGGALLAGAVTAVGMGIVADPLVGVACGLASAVMAWWRPAWWLAVASVPVALLGARLSERPSLAWVAIGVLVADVVARTVTERWRRPPR